MGEQHSGVAGYQLIQDGQPVGGSVTAVTMLDAGLHSQTTYRYQVEAVDGAGNRSTRSSAVTITTPLLGDVNGDRQVTLADVRLLLQMLMGQAPGDLLTADLDGDGQLTLFDAQRLILLLSRLTATTLP